MHTRNFYTEKAKNIECCIKNKKNQKKSKAIDYTFNSVYVFLIISLRIGTDIGSLAFCPGSEQLCVAQ